MLDDTSAANLKHHKAAFKTSAHTCARNTNVAYPNRTERFDEIFKCLTNNLLALHSLLNTEMLTNDSRTIMRIVRDIARALPVLLHRRESDYAGQFTRPFLSKGYKQLRLTRRQRQVLDLLVNGYSNKEIARALSLAEGTVKVHMAALLRALGVANRASAAVVGTRLFYARNNNIDGQSAQQVRIDLVSGLRLGGAETAIERFHPSLHQRLHMSAAKLPLDRP